MMARCISLLAGLTLLLGLSGCLEVDEVLTVKKDGSGTIEATVVLGAQMVAMMEMGAAQAGAAGAPDPMADLYDEEKYRKEASKYGEEVAFEKLEKIEADGKKGVKITYKFADINKVKFSPGSAMDNVPSGGEGAEEEEGDKEPLTFAMKDGELTITFPEFEKNEGAVAESDPAEMDPQQAAMMQMFRDMRISAKLVADPGIAETNASHRDGDTITLMEIQFGKILDQPNGLQILQKMDSVEGPEQAAQVLEGVEGATFETKPEIKLKVK